MWVGFAFFHLVLDFGFVSSATQAHSVQQIVSDLQIGYQDDSQSHLAHKLHLFSFLILIMSVSMSVVSSSCFLGIRDVCSLPTLLPSPCRYRLQPQRIVYIERNLQEKSVKRPFCCTVSILQVYFTYLCYITCWVREYHFIENLKLLLKESQIMKQAGFIIDQ